MGIFKINKRRILLFLAIMGPGIITANVDNDANGIATYSVAGAHYGYSIIWVLLLVTIALIVVQEMCSRMGCITGKGLADLIRENFGVKYTLIIMAVLFIANIANTTGDFAGLAAGAELFGINKYITIPVGVILTWFLVLKSDYKKVEKVFLYACLIYITYIFAGFLAHPDWKEAVARTFVPKVDYNMDFIITAIAVVGTTIAPWMQFYQQSAVRDKGLGEKQYIYSKWDTIIGSFTTNIVAFFIIVACAATLFLHGIRVESAEDAAQALAPLAGNFCKILFGIGLVNAALFSVAIIPLSTAYAICEAFGLESGVDTRFREAPAFYIIYALTLILGAAPILIPNLNLITIMVLSQALNGILLPFILIAMLLLINNKKIMGKWTNSSLFNTISWITAVVLIGATLILIYYSIAPMIH
ncbi:MAG: Nramp family divalent metal transporter [Firmicutes bacterium]|nr:Nramp family divalent metal transporter [Bacillota bacterium]